MRRWAWPPLSSRLRRLTSRVFDLLLRRRREADLDEEIAAHLDLAAAEQRANGLSAEEARAVAERSFGGVLRTKEAYREGRGFVWIDAVAQDTRYALRGFRKNPTFTIVAILTLALAIGANTAIFSIVYSTLIKPLPYRDADRLVLIQSTPRNGGWPLDFAASARPELTARMHTVDDVAFFDRGSYALAGKAGAELVRSSTVSANFFVTMAGRMVAGRPLSTSDDVTPSIVVSARLARRLFGSPAAALGQHLTLTSHVYSVVGVAADSFAFPSPDVDVWDPAGYAQTVALRGNISFHQLIARLKPSTELDQARADIGQAFAAYARAHPEWFPGEVETSVTALPDLITGPFRPLLLILWATVALVLLIACANLANLLLARSAAKQREAMVRVALGASRGRLMAQHLVDSAVLSFASAAAGLVVAGLATIVFVKLAPVSAAWLTHMRFQASAVLFVIAVAVATTLCVGLLPAIQSTSAAFTKQIGPGTSRSSGRRIRRGLSLAQFAAAIVLVIVATLLTRSLVRLMKTDIGVNTRHVTTASVELEYSQHPFNSDTRPRVERMLARLRAMPGVVAAGFGTSLPPDTSRISVGLIRDGDAAPFSAAMVAATPGYFRALGLRLVQGRLFTDADDQSHTPVMVMGETTARRFFGQGRMLGRTLSFPMPAHDGVKGYVKMTLIGVVHDVKYGGLAEPAHDQIYRPLAQQPWPALFLAVRTDRDFPEFSRALRRVIASVDSTAVVSSIRTMDDIVSSDVAPSRFRTAVLVSFAGLALVIAAIGLYGVIAYSVAQRTMEIGIRMALGARTADVTRMVLREGAMLGVIGAAIGLAAAYGVTRLLASLLYGVTPTDPISFGLAAAILLAVALLASYLPARRAAQVDPLAALKAE